MTVFNKRNAMFGWAIWEITKRSAARKARSVAPSNGRGSRLRIAAMAASTAAAVSGAVWFWRRRAGDDETLVETAADSAAEASADPPAEGS